MTPLCFCFASLDLVLKSQCEHQRLKYTFLMRTLANAHSRMCSLSKYSPFDVRVGLGTTHKIVEFVTKILICECSFCSDHRWWLYKFGCNAFLPLFCDHIFCYFDVINDDDVHQSFDRKIRELMTELIILLLLLLLFLHLFSFVINCETAAWDIAATLWNN